MGTKEKSTTSSLPVQLPSRSQGVRALVDLTIVALVMRALHVAYEYLVSLVVDSELLTLPSDSEWKPPAKNGVALFPSISNTKIEPGLSPEVSRAEEVSLPQPCSTGLTTRLLPFKNDKGEIEWAFTDDITPGNELDVFKMSDTNSGRQPAKTSEDDEEINLSPTVSNSSSNNESILSGKQKKKKEEEEEEAESPLTNHSSPFTPQDHQEKKTLSPSSSSEELGDDERHQCPHCEAVFKIRGYLTRHLKKHATKKAYSCPFHKYSIYIDENNLTHKCHPSGGFSRRDTYKTHLKSRHFKYPQGTKTKDRTNSPGMCSMCGEHFPNAEIWCEIHVEGAECRYLPPGFKGKSRIKNRLKKKLTKEQLKQIEENGGTLSDYNMALGKDSPSTYMDSPSSGLGTPGQQHPSMHEYASPSSIVSAGAMPQRMTRSPLQYSTTSVAPLHQYENEDYDDDYCLDTDQLGYNYNEPAAYYQKSYYVDQNTAYNQAVFN